jgi:hypothetical protein
MTNLVRVYYIAENNLRLIVGHLIWKCEAINNIYD